MRYNNYVRRAPDLAALPSPHPQVNPADHALGVCLQLGAGPPPAQARASVQI